jgi:hypothetical protein
MANSFKAIASVLVAAVVLGTAAAAQQPRIENGAVTVQTAASPLAQSFRALVSSQPEVTWIGYAVPVAGRDHVMCCFGSGNNYVSGSMSGNNVCCGVCTLENSSGTTMSSRTESTSPSGAIKLEGPDHMVVLFRIADRRVERVRVFSEDCRLDAGGRPVKWIDNVRPAESVALLESLAATAGDAKDRVTNSAIMAISLHAEPSALETLFRIARSGNEARARSEALFWLAQRAGDKVAATIRERIDQDPDTEVKKRAVFALSQLPKDEGVPLLIQVARTNKIPEVRRQAMFWLGQSRDPRAVDFFAEVLSK